MSSENQLSNKEPHHMCIKDSVMFWWLKKIFATQKPKQSLILHWNEGGETDFKDDPIACGLLQSC